MAQRLSAAGPKAPILARLDSGFDSVRLMREIKACNRTGMPQVDWLTKWNPRKTDVVLRPSKSKARLPLTLRVLSGRS